MSDNSDVYSSARVLVEALNHSFLLKSQVLALTSFLKELLGHLKTEKDKKWSQVYSLIQLLKDLTYFTKLHLLIKERAPKELPILRKIRTFLTLSELSDQFNQYFSKLQGIIETPEISSKFSKGYLSNLFSKDEVQKRIKEDAEEAVQLFLEITIFTGTRGERLIVSDFESLKSKFKEEIGSLSNGVENFGIFKRNDFESFLERVDDKLLRVNRNILMQLDSKRKLQKRLQIPLVENDLDFSGFTEESEEVEEFLKGSFGKFSYALYTPNISKAQRKRFKKLGLPADVKEKVLVQKVSAQEVSSMAPKESLQVGYFLRQLEMNSAQSASENSIVKVFGHFLNTLEELVVVSEVVTVTLAEIYETKKMHVFSAEDVMNVAVSIGRALAFLHRSAQIHGNLLPESVCFTEYSFRGQVKIANFAHGLKREVVEKGVEKSKKAAFTAPEVTAQKKTFAASDIYSMSMIIWSILHSEELPFDYPVSSAEEINHDVSVGVRPFLKYQVHCKKLGPKLRLSPDEWESVSEMVQYMWNQLPEDRPSAEFALEFFSLQSSPDLNKRQTVKVLAKQKSQRFDKDVEDNIRKFLELEAPEAPPRVRGSFDSSTPPSTVRQGSTHTEEQFASINNRSQKSSLVPKHFKPHNSDEVQKKKKKKLMRISSRKYDVEDKKLFEDFKKFKLYKAQQAEQEKHDSMKDSNHAKSDVTHRNTGQPAVVLEMEHDSFPTGVGSNAVLGYDNLPRASVKTEVELFRVSCTLDKIPLKNYVVEDNVNFCMEYGLEVFHNKMRFKYGRGLKRFQEQDFEITELPRKGSKESQGGVKHTSKGSHFARKPRTNKDEGTVGLNGITNFIKQKKRNDSVAQKAGATGMIRRFKSKVTRKSRKFNKKKKLPFLSRPKSTPDEEVDEEKVDF